MHKRGDRRKNRKSKERFTVRVHPLFLLFGLFFFVRGEIFLFLSCTVTAVIHEFGHALGLKHPSCSEPAVMQDNTNLAAYVILDHDVESLQAIYE